jgi:hypothetical protein
MFLLDLNLLNVWKSISIGIKLRRASIHIAENDLTTKESKNREKIIKVKNEKKTVCNELFCILISGKSL